MKLRTLQPAFNMLDDRDGDRFIIDSPEKSLLLAVLWRAVQDAHHIAKRGRIDAWHHANPKKFNIRTLQRKYELLQWFASDCEKPWSLRWILQQLTTDDEAAAVKVRETVRQILKCKKIKMTRRTLK